MSAPTVGHGSGNNLKDVRRVEWVHLRVHEPWGPPQGCRLVQSPSGNVNMCLTCTGSDTWCPDTNRAPCAAMCVCVCV